MLCLRTCDTALGMPQAIYQADLGNTRLLLTKIKSSRARRNATEQASWVSFTQDIAEFLDDRLTVGLRKESADNIPDTFPVGPIKVEMITILLFGVAAGLRVDEYSPRTGELRMVGDKGTISTGDHSALRTQLHYTPSRPGGSVSQQPQSRIKRALHKTNGIWANAIFGRFTDQSRHARYEPLETHVESERQVWEKMATEIMAPVGMAPWWSSETSDWVATFMVFTRVDVSLVFPPSRIYPCTNTYVDNLVACHINLIQRSTVGSANQEPSNENDRDKYDLSPEAERSSPFDTPLGGENQNFERSICEQITVELDSQLDSQPSIFRFDPLKLTTPYLRNLRQTPGLSPDSTLPQCEIYRFVSRIDGALRIIRNEAAKSPEYDRLETQAEERIRKAWFGSFQWAWRTRQDVESVMLTGGIGVRPVNIDNRVFYICLFSELLFLRGLYVMGMARSAGNVNMQSRPGLSRTSLNEGPHQMLMT